MVEKLFKISVSVGLTVQESLTNQMLSLRETKVSVAMSDVKVQVFEVKICVECKDEYENQKNYLKHRK